MKAEDALEKLGKDISLVLIDQNGHSYQKLNDRNIMNSLNPDTLESSTSGYSVLNDKFIEEHSTDVFEKKCQWYDNEIKLPILCKVKEPSFTNYKTVQFNYRNGNMFQTGFGESYTPSHHVEIIPLSDQEIENLKGGYE